MHERRNHQESIERKVWENTNGTHLLTVTGLLEEGEYRVEKKVEEDGTIRLRCQPLSDDN